VWIGDAVACGNVTRKHFPEERAFSGTGAAEDCEMTAARVRNDANRPAVMVGIIAAFRSAQGEAAWSRNYRVQMPRERMNFWGLLN